jgi:hypothetical protein
LALIAVQQIAVTGTALTLSAASGGGDTVRPEQDRVALVVRNADASSKTVTVVRPGTDRVGIAIPDLTVTVAAGATTIIPIAQEFRDSADNLVDITYSAVTSVTVGAFRLT